VINHLFTNVPVRDMITASHNLRIVLAEPIMSSWGILMSLLSHLMLLNHSMYTLIVSENLANEVSRLRWLRIMMSRKPTY